MSLQDLAWGTVHASVYRHGGLMRQALAIPRPHGAMRYCCPTTGSLVLVTDEPTLRDLERPAARLHCADCGEIHMVTVAALPSAIVAPAKNA